MKVYLVINQIWDNIENLYCGEDEEMAMIIFNDAKYKKNNKLEVWENGRCIQYKWGSK